MGRHSLPDAYAPRERGEASARRGRRTVVIATLLVLAVATGTGVAVKGGLLSFSESCEDSAVHLSLAASPDIAPAVRSIAEQARADEVRSDGHCLDVDVVARDSYKVADALAGGGETPDFQVWLPDSDLWLDRAEGLGTGTPISPSDSVASSPVALAVVPSASERLGWPKKTYSWAEVVTAALTADKIRLGSADPARSATGLLALTSIGGSSAQQGGDSDTRVAETAKVLAERMSDSDAQVLETLARSASGAEDGNPKRNQAVLISEQAAFARYGFRPADGAAEDATVTSAGGKSPQPYAASAAEAPSAKALQEMLGMWTITVQSARLTTVVDASGSMSTPVPGRGQSRMDVTKESLIQALGQFTPDDEIGLWEFATTLDGEKDYRKLMETRRLGDPAQGGSTHRERLSAAFAGLQPVPGGATGLYDTMLASYKEARSTYVKGKFNALVILTDGSDQDDDGISRSALNAELKELTDPERPVPVIAIAVGPDADREEVAEIARVTGGDGYEVSDPVEIQAVILQAIMAAGQNGRAAQE
ncbi:MULTISPECIES: VWA domain-containing protein [Streptomyces]|uniref:VWA domain-containing protein n=1 Tax=Streptomyces TaxID=1883 RepID=UPI00194E4606|nr:MULTISPECIES: VWA domain-containing protein [Streptomyces]